MDTRTQAEKDLARDAVRDQVFNTVELLEMILSEIVDPIEIISLRAVSKVFCGTIDASKSLTESFMFFQKQDMVLHGPTLDAIFQQNNEEEEWPTDAAKGLFNPHFLCIGRYYAGYANAAYRYETDIRGLPWMQLDHDDEAQETTLLVAPDKFSNLPTSSSIGLLTRMFFTCHPIPILKLELENQEGKSWTFEKDAEEWDRVEIKLKIPRLGEVLDICWRMRAVASIRERRLARQKAEQTLRKLRRQEKTEWERWGDDDEEEIEEVEKCTCAPGKYCFRHWDWKDQVEDELLKICIDQPKVDGEDVQ
ncbi:hypothetical protein HII31_06521 [Pseudocercospora fuligena]|uniref:F-box domain-containing protein n=1 Tax=Pseudocercospora fuligena TaxID=685502 RepID=A0A8H6RHX3_9PEZI|nr:hypothetical protein HII31_06521 [Pseudocercospora fuligena]